MTMHPPSAEDRKLAAALLRKEVRHLRRNARQMASYQADYDATQIDAARRMALSLDRVAEELDP